jgi:serine/threonine-protein kinase HipA
MEDMCQLTERLTEHKYKGSNEQIGKSILKYSANPMLDIVNFFEQVFFSYLTGNADMHLKNFSLINQPGLGWILAPAYDMVASALVVEGDEEELALNLNGKKKRLKIDDFRAAMRTCHVPDKAAKNILGKFENANDTWSGMIETSFVSDQLKTSYSELVTSRMKKLFR